MSTPSHADTLADLAERTAKAKLPPNEFGEILATASENLVSSFVWARSQAGGLVTVYFLTDGSLLVVGAFSKTSDMVIYPVNTAPGLVRAFDAINEQSPGIVEAIYRFSSRALPPATLQASFKGITPEDWCGLTLSQLYAAEGHTPSLQ